MKAQENPTPGTHGDVVAPTGSNKNNQLSMYDISTTLAPVTNKNYMQTIYACVCVCVCVFVYYAPPLVLLGLSKH
jgi:hypothetical protein